MSSWRSTGLAIWALASIALLPGCSTTSLPGRLARVATGQVKPNGTVPYDRLVSIGQTFEAQGNHQKAQRMYNMVLSRQPGNSKARQSLQRLAESRKNNGRVFEGTGQPAPVSPVQQSPIMMASASVTEAPVKRKSFQTLTAASTVPFRTPGPARSESSPATQVAAFNTPASSEQPAEEEWTLPRVAPAPAFANPEAGRVAIANLEPTERPFVMPVSATVTETVPAGPINIEACLDNPEEHIGALTGALSSTEPDVRSLAAFLLGEAGESARPSLSALKARLATEDSEAIRITVAESISKLDGSDSRAMTLLLSSLTSQDASIRSQAAFALRVFAGSGEPKIVRGLELALADSNKGVAAMAALSLSDFGADAKTALPALEAAKSGADKDVRDALNAAIARIKG